jgi:hypothetical protein
MRHGIRERPLEKSLGVGILEVDFLGEPVRQFAQQFEEPLEPGGAF